MTTLNNPLNFIKAVDPRTLKLPAKFLAKGLIPLGIFITGYSAAPAGYADPTQKYEEGFVDNLKAQGKAPVLITSPTVTPDSIDAIGTIVAHEKKTDILYVTAAEFLKYVDPDQLPETADKKRFIEDPKYYFADRQAYSLASAAASDITEVTGGRDTAVRDFKNAVDENKEILLVHNSRLPVGFDNERNRPKNAEEYLETMIRASMTGQTLPYPPVSGFDATYLKDHRNAILNVKVDNVDDPKYTSAPPVKDLWRNSASDTNLPQGKPDERDASKLGGPKTKPNTYET